VTRAALLAFMRGERHAAVASVAADGAPQAAVVGVVFSDDFEVFFDTLDRTRKAVNLRARGRAAFVIGGFEATAARTVQLEGVADEPRGTDLEHLKQLYFERFDDGPTRQAWPGLIYVRVRPTWLRYTDFRQSPPFVLELDATTLERLK
jgi:Pyridoxamine 5'-phosphate oxidase